MERLESYVAFDLEFNQFEGAYQIIQVSAVKFEGGKEVASYDSYAYTDKPLKSFINGLTGITADKILQAPKLEQVLADFQAFVGSSPLIGYNAHKSDLPILLENGVDLVEQYGVDVFDEAYERRPSDLHGIKNLQLHTVADFLGLAGKSHDSLEDARMTARVYEQFLEFDEARNLVTEQSSLSNNPFGGLDLSSFFED
ncbi:DNA polymerase III alpha subunit / DNA polymerase III epsilon chain [Streptococcus sp. DD10]|uniref:3'-5' exonuclease n=1 Tax=Streptococcus sp. DD10 TaxID=1777878 RepID=UPI00079550F7|nr:3'-5' exonuclease [Streptococcus sp. DD10]KXT72931.1 DNA polymerase III alpha subunit / DNA polymerase III epsilon chain [Streptococcus sp. DD10]